MALNFLNDGYFAGKVGIGTESPLSRLEVYGGSSGVNDVDRYVRFKASNGEKRFDFYVGGTGNASMFNMYTSDGTTKNVQIASGGTSYFNGGNVGIGTISPGAKLDVQGTILVNNEIQFVDGNMRIFRSSNDMRFRTGGSDKMTILSGGNVGIGTTSPALQSGGTGLHINATTSSELKFTNNTTGSTASDGTALVSNGNDFTINNREAGTMTLGTSNSARITILSGGDVGIGTTAPSQKLHISGNMRLTGAFRDRLNSQGAANYVLTSTGSNGTQWVDASGSSIIGGPYLPLSAGSTKPLTGSLYMSGASTYVVGGDSEILVGQDAGGYYLFTGFSPTVSKPVYIGDNASFISINAGGSTRIRIDGTTGNVGIGATNPAVRLDFGASTGKAFHLYTSSSDYYGFNMLQYDSGPFSTNIFSGNGGEIKLRTGSGTSIQSTRLTVAADGNVGIGTAPNQYSGYTTLTIGNASGTGSILDIEYQTIRTLSVYAASNGGNINVIAAKPLILLTSGAERMRVLATGQIGMGTTNPTEKLEVVGNIKITAAVLSNQENADVDTGTETVAEFSAAAFTAGFFDFVIKKTTNVRSGTVYACHDGTTVQFTETSTQDLGDTSDVTLSVDISGTDMRLRATTTSDNWSIKSLIRAI